MGHEPTSFSQLKQGARGAWLAVTANATLKARDSVSNILANKATAIVITLPAAGDCKDRIFTIKQGGIGVAEIRSAAAGETIEGMTCNAAGVKLVNKYDYVSLMSDGYDWYIVEKHCPVLAATVVTDAECQTELTKFPKCLADHVVFGSGAIAGAQDCTLPDASTVLAGMMVTFSSCDITHFFTVKATTSTICDIAGATGVPFTVQGQSITVVSDGTNWV